MKQINRSAQLIKLIGNGFLGDFKSVEQIKTEFIRMGGKRFCKNLEVTLLTYVTQEKLEREKRRIGNKSVWVYKVQRNSPIRETEHIFTKNSRYDFYSVMSDIVISTKKELYVVDPFIDDSIFDLYMKKVKPNVKVRILTNPEKPHGSFHNVALKFKSQRKEFEVREDLDCHDRMVFCDSEAWVFGQSIKSAGNKPTYLVMIKKSSDLKNVWDNVWNQSKKRI